MHGLSGLNEDGSARPHMLGHYFLAIDVSHYVPLTCSGHCGDYGAGAAGFKEGSGR